MEPMLVTLAFVSLALACAMSVVAWKLLKDRHDRSAARVEALQAMAFAESTADVTTGSEVSFPRGSEVHVPRRSEVTSVPLATPASPPSLAELWDVALGHASAHEIASAREIGPMAPVIFDSPAPAAPTLGPAGRRWMAVAAVALVLAAVVSTLSALRTPEIVAALAASRPAPAEAPLELISLQHRVDATGGFQVTGLVQNPANGVLLKDVVAVVYLFDERGN